ncbi:MAG: L-glutamine synthetase [Armatimonadetes bacterium]|jgi:glutamine synthetase|nr:L-glutamine synthetase [Armatimonadota bacterium]
MPKTPADVLNLAKEQGIKIVDYRFIDMPGVWQHFSVPVQELSMDSFEEGLGFDGSSIRGFQQIQESDMLLFPDPSTAFVDPFSKYPQLNIICDVRDPLTHETYSRDPRNIVKKADAYLKQTGIADTIFFGPEAEFFIFDDARFDQNAHSGYYFLDSGEAAWNTGRVEEGGNLGYKIRHKEGYFPCPPMDQLQDIRSEMVLTMADMGMRVELHHHEVATAGQCEIDLRFAPMLEMADTMMKYKYAIKNVARRNGKTATFMPKPIFGDNGSGMHCHQSLWKNGQPLFYDESGYAGLSEMAIYYIGGLLKHAPSLLAFTNPTTNSYRRLVPGYEAPVNLMYSQRNRSACVRIPMYSSSPKAKRIEFRCPDPSCNPYLAFAAMLMAGLDGIQNRIMPPTPVDKDLYELESGEKRDIKQTPGSLSEVLNALEGDHQFLLKGGVFTTDVIDTWIEYKRSRELEQVNLRPHPYEFYLYFDI